MDAYPIFSFLKLVLICEYVNFLEKIPKERGHFADIGVERTIILKWIFKIHDGRMRTGFIWLRIGTSGGIL
jgi:hypothetical protein